MPSLRLRISTRILINPGFMKAPAPFALRNGIDLVGEPAPETSFAKDPDTREKTAKVKVNIHLVRYDAIRLLANSYGADYWIESIDVNPSLLLHGDGDHPLTEEDKSISLGMLRDTVTPLLADPMDSCHIIPGQVGDGKHLAFWSSTGGEVCIPGIKIPGLHGISHPDTGLAEGSTDKRIKLESRDGNCVICFEAAQWQTTAPDGVHRVEGVRVSLLLKGDSLLAAYRQPANTASVRDKERLVSLRAGDVARVHQIVMSRLEGTYLPVPPEWTGEGGGYTPARVMALLSVLTPMPLVELRAMDVKQRNPSTSTINRLNNDVPEAVACLHPVPVATLFSPAVYAAQVGGSNPQPDAHVDPLMTDTSP